MTVEPTYPVDYDGEIEIEPFTRHNWKTAEARDFWKPHLQACERTYPLVEISAITDPATSRKVAVVERHRLRDERYVNLIAEKSLAVVTRHDKAFIALGKPDANVAANAYSNDDAATLGELLGYPDCCIDHYGNTVYEMACRSDGAEAADGDRETIHLDDAPGLLNPFWNYMGWQFISHQPCSFDCEASESIAQTHGTLYREHDVGEDAERLWEFLATPVEWSGYHGINHFTNGYLIGGRDATADYWSEKIVKFRGESARKLDPPE